MTAFHYILMLLCFLWISGLIISAYGTYRLYEYGPHNANLAWELVRRWTDALSSVSFGMALGWYFGETANWNMVYLFIIFLFGYLAGRIILLLTLHLVASPYIKREREDNKRFDAIQKEEADRIASGIPPERISLFPNDKEWIKANITRHKVE